MEKTLLSVLVVAVCLGVCSAQVSCPDRCLELSNQIRRPDFSIGDLIRYYAFACWRCSNYQTSTATTTSESATASTESSSDTEATTSEGSGSARINARPHLYSASEKALLYSAGSRINARRHLSSASARPSLYA
ncbi:uncharacterized protein LOC124545287 [Schistocerca americana]|uniref:uncharacterized protein LOC124545287 n=1 Tax=Schistocerca americana TaxID=7009 RepID=UPI001F4FE025|nr:uncharacterized protein LOC124545287 [Schistocerca americana]